MKASTVWLAVRSRLPGLWKGILGVQEEVVKNRELGQEQVAKNSDLGQEKVQKKSRVL